MKKIKNQIANEVAEVYARLDKQIAKQKGSCRACGACCDFATFGHKLFVSSSEMIYFGQNVDILPMNTDNCPYQKDNKCTVHPYRFSGCRIFLCTADAELQSSLSEEVLQKFRQICDKYNLPWRYTDLAAALNITAPLLSRL